VPTPKLNRWLREMETLHPPPLAKGRRIRLRFMTQIKTRPPTFVLSVSQLGEDYLRFLINRLRDDFGLPGVPIRLPCTSPGTPTPAAPGNGARPAPKTCCQTDNCNPKIVPSGSRGGADAKRLHAADAGSGCVRDHSIPGRLA
jgi:hypothetical protein